LAKDSAEVFLAMLYATDLARMLILEGLKQVRADAILEALKRRDLTGAEGCRLYQALNEELRQTETAALREQELKRQQGR
jgi:hypothetical protein